MSAAAEQIEADALEAQKFSRKHMVLELDFSPASIELLERNTDDVEYAIKGGFSDENVDMLTRIWGAYVGEAIRKQIGGEWVDDGGQLVLKTDDATLRPHDQVRQRLTSGSDQSIAQYFEGVTKQQP